MVGERHKSLEEFDMCIIIASKNGKFGALKSNFEEVLSFKFDEIELRRNKNWGFYYLYARLGSTVYDFDLDGKLLFCSNPPK